MIGPKIKSLRMRATEMRGIVTPTLSQAAYQFVSAFTSGAGAG